MQTSRVFAQWVTHIYIYGNGQIMLPLHLCDVSQSITQTECLEKAWGNTYKRYGKCLQKVWEMQPNKVNGGANLC